MLAYQAGIAKFEEAGAVVVGISTDNLPTLSHWSKEELKLSFPLASDFSKRSVAEAYGVLNKDSGVANRATFVIDKHGIVRFVERYGRGELPDPGKILSEVAKLG